MHQEIETQNWVRKEHFAFFKAFDEPFFGINAEIEIGSAVIYCKQKNIRLFHYYLFQTLRALNRIDEFRTRIVDDKPVIFDKIHASSTISRPDKTFGFSFIPFSDDFSAFSESVSKETEEVASVSGLRMTENTSRTDVIHLSVLPWIRFTSVSHARHFAYRDSVPKITFGKIYESGNKQLIPVSVHAHHGLMDAWHVAEFYRIFSELLTEKV